jgi:uncharacterized membrane protein YheB (UPF0754 family)
MLFHPRAPWGPKGFQVQGLLPRRQRDLSEKIGAAVAEKLLSDEEISSILGKIHWHEEVEGIVHAVLRRDLVPRKVQKLPGMARVLAQLQGHLTGRIMEALDEHMDSIVERFHDELDVKEMVVEKLAAQDPDELERLVFSLSARELRHIELIGGLFGLAVGTVQSILFYASRH